MSYKKIYHTAIVDDIDLFLVQPLFSLRWEGIFLSQYWHIAQQMESSLRLSHVYHLFTDSFILTTIVFISTLSSGYPLRVTSI